MKGIEFVCLGNNGRSPVAEIVAKKVVQKLGANIPISSSGLGVDLFMKAGPKPNAIAALKSLGIEGESLYLTQKFIELESKFRNEALSKCGYSPLENHKPQQTDPAKDVDLMLTMDVYLEDSLGKMSPKARVMSIGYYSFTEIPHIKLSDWLTTANAHVTYLRVLEEAMPKAIGMYLKEITEAGL